MERPGSSLPLASLKRRAAKVADWFRRRKRRAREPHGLVLLYHRIASPRADPWHLAVTPAHFDDQLRVLRERVDLVPLGRLRDNLRPGTGERPVAALTFDDGYLDNLLAARPILERHRVPATVFVASGLTGHAEGFWWDRLADAILLPAALPATLILREGADGFVRQDASLTRSGASGRRARRRLHDDLWRWLAGLAEEDRSREVARIEAWACPAMHPDPAARPMTAAELRELAASGLVEIGAHSVTHPRLTALSRGEKQAEIGHSRRGCTDIIGTAPGSFAYPNGDYDAECVDLVRDAGFTVACTSRPDLVWASGDPLETPRISVPDCDGEALWRFLRWRWLP